MALRVVYLFDIVVVGDSFGLGANYFVITSHYDNSPEFSSPFARCIILTETWDDQAVNTALRRLIRVRKSPLRRVR
jgi:hypothetical protein